MHYAFRRVYGFSLVELIVVIAVIAILAVIIIPMMYDLTDASRVTSQKRNIQLWNQSYVDAYTAGADDITTANNWDTASSRLAAGVTTDLGNGTVTFVCQPPKFINAGNPPTFVPGQGITAAP